MVPNNGQWDTYQNLTAGGTFNLTAGSQTIRLSAGATSWTWNLDKFTLTRIGTMKAVTSEVVPSLALMVYPNPAQDLINLSMQHVDADARVVIYNNVGTMLNSRKMIGQEMQISLSYNFV